MVSKSERIRCQVNRLEFSYSLIISLKTFWYDSFQRSIRAMNQSAGIAAWNIYELLSTVHWFVLLQTALLKSFSISFTYSILQCYPCVLFKMNCGFINCLLTTVYYHFFSFSSATFIFTRTHRPPRHSLFCFSSGRALKTSHCGLLDSFVGWAGG